MKSRIQVASVLSLWILLPFLATFLAQKRSSAILAMVFYAFIVAAIFISAALAVPVRQKHGSRVNPEHGRWLYRLFVIWGLVLACFQMAIVVRILSERGAMTLHPIRELAGSLTEILSPFIPALRKLPQDMIAKGFPQTAQLVTDCYAFAYTAAVINLGVSFPILLWLLVRYFGRRELASARNGFDDMPGEKKIAALLSWPVLIATYIFAVFIDTGVRFAPGRREHLAYFETSEFHLYFRSLLGTGLGTIGACALLWTTIYSLSIYAARFLYPSKNSDNQAIG
jgi:hypothetical protein